MSKKHVPITSYYDVSQDKTFEMTDMEIKTHRALMALPQRALVDSLIAHRRLCPLCKGVDKPE